jgi:raffinose/stachyose/melibiose transport system permease protein
MNYARVGSDGGPVNKARLKPGELTTIALFLLPAFAFFFIFLIYPILRAGYVSFFDWNGFGPPTDYVALENYQGIFQDIVFRRSLLHSLAIVVLSITLQLPLALGLALIVSHNVRGRVFFRTIYFLPFVLAEVSTALIWRYLLDPSPTRGFVNAIFDWVGLPTVAWLGDPDVVMFAIFMALTWKYFGYHMLLYLAGLQNIPIDINEAAKIDGANTWQLIRFITIPLLGPTIRLTIYLSVLGSLQQFATVTIMTKGGPAYASEMLVTYLYRFGFIRFAYGYGSAAAVIIFLICLTFSLVYQSFIMKQDTVGAAQ